MVRCSTVATAAALYEACDGVEFGRSGCVFDMRFIPDDLVIQQKPREPPASDVPHDYEAGQFNAKALQQTKLSLSWDVDDDDRVRAFQWHSKPPSDIKEDDFKNYLGSGSESSEDDAKESAAQKKKKKDRAALRNRYKSLLGHIGVSVDSDGNAVAGAGNGGSSNDEDSSSSDEDDDEGVVERSFFVGLDKKLADNARARDETVYERFLREKKEKRKKARFEKKQAAKQKAPGGAGNGNDDEDDDSVQPEDEDDFFSNLPEGVDPFEAWDRMGEEMTKQQQGKGSRGKGKKPRNKQGHSKDGDDGAGEDGDSEDARRRRKAELALVAMDDNFVQGSSSTGVGVDGTDGDDEDGDSRKKKKLTRKQKREARKAAARRARALANGETIDEDAAAGSVDTSDPRFKDIFSNANFAIDRTHSKFKETPGMRKLLQEKIQRSEEGFRAEAEAGSSAPSQSKRKVAVDKVPAGTPSEQQPKRKRRRKKKGKGN